MSRIGVLGGTFDPPHRGHRHMALGALEQLGLDEVILVPTKQNPIRKRQAIAPAPLRLEMTGAMVKDEPNLSVSNIELSRPGPSYTYQTLEELSLIRPAAYWFILGADSLDGLERWKNLDRIVQLARFAVATRDRHQRLDGLIHRLPHKVQERLDKVELEPHPASSTTIRTELRTSPLVDRWLDPEVKRIIEREGLYQET